MHGRFRLVAGVLIQKGNILMKEQEKIILEDIRRTLFDHFGKMIDRILLYGSRARGDATEGSDWDILVVVHGPVDWKLENRILDACYEVDLKHDILIDIKVLSKDELNTVRGRQPYILNAFEQWVYA
jgi:uncharacterized protein